METRPVSRRAVLTTLVGAGAAGTAAAQQVSPLEVFTAEQPEPLVLSGSDLGFRVERTRRDGVRIGSLVVKVEGKWVEAELGHGIRFGTADAR